MFRYNAEPNAPSSVADAGMPSSDRASDEVEEATHELLQLYPGMPASDIAELVRAVAMRAGQDADADTGTESDSDDECRKVLPAPKAVPPTPEELERSAAEIVATDAAARGPGNGNAAFNRGPVLFGPAGPKLTSCGAPPW